MHAEQRVTVTHPFHPLAGREYEVVTVRDDWGENRVCYYDEKRRLKFIPTEWTNLWPEDPFMVVASGRTPFRAVDLLQLAELLDCLNQEVR